jgi:serine/threonine-protein kinase
MQWMQVFAQVCQAVGYAHGQGVIHRDLKPSNVMVGQHGEVQVIDWGVAKVLTISEAPPAETPAANPHMDTWHDDCLHTCNDSVLGTFAYMSPEQARGSVEEVDQRSDVFGLGAILCEILTGAPPYTAGDGKAVHRQAKEADLADALARIRGCGADPELVQLATQCLAPRRDERPPDSARVAAAVAEYLSAVQERLQQGTRPVDHVLDR